MFAVGQGFGKKENSDAGALLPVFGIPARELTGMDEVLAEVGVGIPLEMRRRLVLVGNRISPRNPATKADGTVLRTMWGSLTAGRVFRGVPHLRLRAPHPDRLPDSSRDHLRPVARTVYLGSAPTTAAAHRGIDDSRVKLGCVMPGESPAVFGDALRRPAEATYLYQDGPRQWYATQPTVTKLAEDRAEQLAGNPDVVARELEERLKKDLRSTGDFDSHPHPAPLGSGRAGRPRRAAGGALRRASLFAGP